MTFFVSFLSRKVTILAAPTISLDASCLIPGACSLILTIESQIKSTIIKPKRKLASFPELGSAQPRLVCI